MRWYFWVLTTCFSWEIRKLIFKWRHDLKCLPKKPWYPKVCYSQSVCLWNSKNSKRLSLNSDISKWMLYHIVSSFEILISSNVCLRNNDISKCLLKKQWYLKVPRKETLISESVCIGNYGNSNCLVNKPWYLIYNELCWNFDISVFA